MLNTDSHTLQTVEIVKTAVGLSKPIHTDTNPSINVCVLYQCLVWHTTYPLLGMMKSAEINFFKILTNINF